MLTRRSTLTGLAGLSIAPSIARAEGEKYRGATVRFITERNSHQIALQEKLGEIAKSWGITLDVRNVTTDEIESKVVIDYVGGADTWDLIYTGGVQRMAQWAYGGIITAGPLQGTAFGPGGTPFQFNYGSIVSGTYMQGGDWQTTDTEQNNSLDSQLNRQSVFSRASYNLTPDINVFVQASYAYSEQLSINSFETQFSALNVNPITNPFVPAATKARAAALGLTTIQVGTMNGDLQPYQAGPNSRSVYRYVAGAAGDFNVFGKEVDWDGYIQDGENTLPTGSTRGCISLPEVTEISADHEVTRGGSGEILAEGGNALEAGVIREERITVGPGVDGDSPCGKSVDVDTGSSRSDGRRPFNNTGIPLDHGVTGDDRPQL